jgi:hypothetical protein
MLSGTLSRAGGIVLAVGASAVAARIVWGGDPQRLGSMTHRGWLCDLRSLGLTTYRGWLGDAVYGTVLTAAAMMVLFAIYVRGGWLVITAWRWQTAPFGQWCAMLWISFLTSLQAALGEEAMFRGYLLNGLTKAWGPARGIVATSVMFALPHLLNSSARETALPLFLVAITGPSLLLGWAYLRAGSLWLPVGIHFAWNFVQNGLLNLPGRTGPNVFGAQARLTGAPWLVGTSYGVEVGLLSLIPLGIVAPGVYIWLRYRGR